MHVGFGSTILLISSFLILLNSLVFFYLFFMVDYLQRLDIIQDLRFETATTRIKVTPDGEYLIASGDLSFQICA